MSTPREEQPLTGRELEPAVGTGQLPAPHDLVGILRQNLEAVVLEERKARGEVHAPEDTYPVIRRIGAIAEGLQDYGRAFVKVGKEAAGYVQDELEQAVGEQDGIPLSGMRVPDEDGTDLRLELDKRYSYDIDLEPVLTAAAMFTMGNHPAMAELGKVLNLEAGEWASRWSDLLADLMVEGMRTLIACGKFEPQTTKVNQLKTEIARISPKVASTITIKRSAEFRGVKITREQPK